VAAEFARISRPAAGLRLLDARHRPFAVVERPALGSDGHPASSLFDQPALEAVLLAQLDPGAPGEPSQQHRLQRGLVEEARRRVAVGPERRSLDHGEGAVPGVEQAQARRRTADAGELRGHPGLLEHAHGRPVEVHGARQGMRGGAALDHVAADPALGEEHRRDEADRSGSDHDDGRAQPRGHGFVQDVTARAGWRCCRAGRAR